MKPKSSNCSKLIILLSLTLATLSFFSWIKTSGDPTCWFDKFCLYPRPGLARLPYSIDSCGQLSDNAWVMMGNNEAAFQQILVSAKSLRSLHTKGDIVVLNFAPSLPKCMQTAFQDLCIRVKNVHVPVTRNDVTNPIYKKVIDDINKWWDFAKLLAYDMVDYNKVVFVDGDTMFLRDPDVWLAQPPGTCTDGPKSPFNSGMFVLEPSSEDFMTLLGLVRNGDYELKTGWGGAFKDEEKKYRPRTYAPFYGAETTQGLFYYFYHDLKKQYNALYPREAFHYQGNEDPPGLDRSKDGEMPHLVHFNICPKPQPGKAMEECPEMHRKWNEMFDSLEIADCHM